MAGDARIVLQQRLSQQLVMTPQLRQAIKILQVSRAELETLVDQELTENPVLEEQLDEKAEGQTEVPTVDGQITQLILLKRQSYGRAKLDLLRQRMLHAA